MKNSRRGSWGSRGTGQSPRRAGSVGGLPTARWWGEAAKPWGQGGQRAPHPKAAGPLRFPPAVSRDHPVSPLHLTFPPGFPRQPPHM